MATQPPELDIATQTQLAKGLFNLCWDYMLRSQRTVEDDDRMLAAAYASFHHWSQVGQPAHACRGHWQLSRVHCLLNRTVPALYHAQRCLEICEVHAIGDWDLAFAYEALARAHARAGHGPAAKKFLQLAQDAGQKISEAEDREMLEKDLATIHFQA